MRNQIKCEIKENLLLQEEERQTVFEVGVLFLFQTTVLVVMRSIFYYFSKSFWVKY